MNPKEQAQQNDKLIEDLALYSVSRGAMRLIDSKEKLVEIQERFAEYKSLIRRGEFTYNELATDVYNRYGLTDPLVEAPKYNQELADAIMARFEKVQDQIGRAQGGSGELAHSNSVEPTFSSSEMTTPEKVVELKWYQKLWRKFKR